MVCCTLYGVLALTGSMQSVQASKEVGFDRMIRQHDTNVLYCFWLSNSCFVLSPPSNSDIITHTVRDVILAGSALSMGLKLATVGRSLAS